MKGVEGQYADALKKRRSVMPIIIEVSGGMSRHTKAHLRHLAARSKAPPARLIARARNSYGRPASR